MRALLRRLPQLDFITAFDVGLSRAEDRELLLWAALNECVLLTHDRKTMPKHFAALFEKGEALSGVFVVPRRMPIGQAINELEIVISCSATSEWRSVIKILPL